jgi:predicted dehydrogenase
MNVGLVGCGIISDAHLKAWRRIESARVAAVCDTNEERAAEVAGRWRVPSYYNDLECMIRHEGIEFLSICTPPKSHVDAACKAITSDVNVVVEKPLAMTTKEVEQIEEVSRRSTAKLMVISNLLYRPAVSGARRAFASLHQEPVSADVHFLRTPDDSNAADSSHWGHRLPGGIFTDHLFHALYLIRFFLGDLQLKAVHLDKFGILDWMRYDELTVFLGSQERRASIHVSFNSSREETFLDLYGQKNALRAELMTNDVYVFRDPEKRWAGKGFEAARQTFMSVENTLRLVSDSLTFHLGVQHTAHELNIRDFVEDGASKRSVLTLEDAYRITQLQEDITTLIDKHGP